MKSINLCFFTIIFLLLGCKKESDAIISEPISLDGTKWIMLESKEIPLSKDKAGPTLIFGPENVGIITNCNLLSTDYKLNGTMIQFGDAYSTYKYCSDMKMEAYFHSNLKRITSYKYSEDILYLYIGKKIIGSFKRIKDI